MQSHADQSWSRQLYPRTTRKHTRLGMNSSRLFGREPRIMPCFDRHPQAASQSHPSMQHGPSNLRQSTGHYETFSILYFLSRVAKSQQAHVRRGTECLLSHAHACLWSMGSHRCRVLNDNQTPSAQAAVFGPALDDRHSTPGWWRPPQHKDSPLPCSTLHSSAAATWRAA